MGRLIPYKWRKNCLRGGNRPHFIIMDNRNRVSKIAGILNPIIGQTLHMNKLWRRIILEVGSTDAVVRETMNLMISLGMITEVSDRMYKVISSKANI